MKRVLMFAAVGAVALSACSGADQQTSDLPSAPGVLAAKPVADACSFKDASGYVTSYFKLSADRKTANDFLKAAEAAEKGTAERQLQLLNVFKLISTKRAVTPSVVNAPVHAAKLVLEGRDCGPFVISHDDAHIEDVLTEAIRNDPGDPPIGGAFAYRGGTDGGFVATVDGGSALWTASWNTWIGGPSIAFGAKWTTSFGNELLVGKFAYRWGLIYGTATGAHGPKGNGNDDIAVVELCEPGVDYTADPRNRVGRVRAGGAKTVLQVADIDGFCPSVDPPKGGIVSRVLRFFAPTPLQARRRSPPGMSGGLDDLSDIIGVNPLAIGLAFATQPASGLLSEPFLVRVRASTAAGNDFEDVPVILSIAGNQGVPAGATLTAVEGCGLGDTTPSLTERTNELGIASFCVVVNKSGGYRLQVEHGLVGTPASPEFAAVVLVSDLFNRTP